MLPSVSVTLRRQLQLCVGELIFHGHMRVRWYLERAGVPRSIEDLLLHDCIIEQSGGVPEPWRIGPDRVVNVNGRKLRSNSGRVAREVALAGLGLAYLPSYLVGADIAAGKLRSVLSDFVDVQLPLFALYPTHHRTARVLPATLTPSTSPARYFGSRTPRFKFKRLLEVNR